MINSVAGKLVYILTKSLIPAINFKVKLKKVRNMARKRIIDKYRRVLLFLSDMYFFVFQFLLNQSRLSYKIFKYFFS